MTIKKITQFLFPVGEKALSQSAYYHALSQADSGFYPFGENGIWHGGIHIDKAVLSKVGHHDKLRCIANGEVVAYRINDVYPKIIYPDNITLKTPYTQLQKVAYFSTGFTLVRHLLQMPKIANSTNPPPSITLYSLYMHQLDWYGYQQKNQASETEVVYPPFWSITSGKISAKTCETIKGCPIRINGSKTEVRGLLLKGSKIRLGAQKANSGWYQIIAISDGTLVTPSGMQSSLNGVEGYVYKKEVTPIPTGKAADDKQDYLVSKDENSQLGSNNVEVKGIAVYASADEGKKLTYLPHTATFEFDGQQNQYAKIRKITGCTVPPVLNAENGSINAPHQGYVKIASLSALTYQPKAFDEVVVLDQPVPISAGDFIGYLGHSVSQSQRFDEAKATPLSNMKRVSDNNLPQLGHIELFTCDDLPAFINKTRALADSLPASEKTRVLVEKDARLIQESKAAGCFSQHVVIHLISHIDSYYVKVKPEYTLTIPSQHFDLSLSSSPVFTTQTRNMLQGQTQNNSDKPDYRLTKEDKTRLLEFNRLRYPELTLNDIPDKVELICIDKSQGMTATTATNNNAFHFRFTIEHQAYWIASKSLLSLPGQSGQLNKKTNYWHHFPLSLDNLPPATEHNTVHFPRTVSIAALHKDQLIATDDKQRWVYVTAGNRQGDPIDGWVNITPTAQAHIKHISPWHWAEFNTIEEKATLGELSDKISKNQVTKLDLADYTPAMTALHRILTQTYLSSTQSKKPLPPFTYKYLKQGLRSSWTAQQIGHLVLNYESEWYADTDLSKWKQIDQLFEAEKQQQKALIEEGLDKLGITRPYQRDFAMEKVDEAHEHVKSNWQREKEQRIKPSLWWQQVAQAQATQTAKTNTPLLTNLSADGKAWFIHPVAMIDYFSGNTLLFKKGDKHEIIREINIRLAGFGGNVPTDEFTERTENMIKQFQRDYMKVDQTGAVDLEVIKAIDEFSDKYDLPSNEWVKKSCTYDEQMFCPCGLCDGFGKSRHKGMYYKNSKKEATHRYEYPGIHRSLLWALKAVIFYLQKENSVYSFRKISSGYRCYDRNIQKNRKSTNHKGKALDIHFNKNGVRTRSCDDMNKLRKDIFNKYLGAKWDWLAGQENMFNLESYDTGATSWVHYDVRQFDQIFLKDEYFCKDSETLNGKPLASLLLRNS